jgi:RNA polymerase sigma-70 factor, ECF subfamily
MTAAAELVVHTDRLTRVAYALTGSVHDADDLVQETFARVLARPRRVRCKDMLRYLLRALRNTWIDLERARSVRPATSGQDALEWVVDRRGDPSTVALDVRVAFDAMRELSPKLRAAIAAVDVLGLSYRDAAQALRIREGTLQSRLARARDNVASALLAGEATA